MIIFCSYTWHSTPSDLLDPHLTITKLSLPIPLFFLPFSLVLRRSLSLFLSIIPFQLCTISSLFYDDLLHQMTMQMKWTTNQEKYFWIGLFDWSTVFSFDTVETQQMIPFPTVFPFLPSENFIFLVVLHHKQRKLHKCVSPFIGSFNTIFQNRSLFFFTEHKSSPNKRFFFLYKIVFFFLFLALAKLWNSLLFCSARLLSRPLSSTTTPSRYPSLIPFLYA